VKYKAELTDLLTLRPIASLKFCPFSQLSPMRALIDMGGKQDGRKRCTMVRCCREFNA